MEKSLNFAETVSSMHDIHGHGSLLVCINLQVHYFLSYSLVHAL